jgi:DNA-binding transcriptional MerR regulator
MYSPDAVDRVRLIRRALGVGFSLAELAKILKVRDGGGAPCRQVKRILEEKLGQVNDQIVELTAMREYLGTVLEDWDRRLEDTPDGKPARLLESLTAGPRSKQPTLKGKIA